MDKNKLRSLSRKDLLEILVQQAEIIEKLNEELDTLKNNNKQSEEEVTISKTAEMLDQMLLGARWALKPYLEKNKDKKPEETQQQKEETIQENKESIETIKKTESNIKNENVDDNTNINTVLTPFSINNDNENNLENKEEINDNNENSDLFYYRDRNQSALSQLLNASSKFEEDSNEGEDIMKIKIKDNIDENEEKNSVKSEDLTDEELYGYFKDLFEDN